jgi:CHASE2 domain-containing sensor protein
MRFLGWSLSWEISAFNRLLSLRPHERQDTRILLVIATPEDMKTQPVPPTGKASLSDQTLALLLDKIQKYYKPVTIGIDIYRDFPAAADSKLGAALKQNNVFGICKVRSSLDGDSEGIAPSPEMGEQQIAFADFVADSDRVVRRHLLAMNRSADATDPCTAVNSFSFLLALHYLQTAKNIGFGYTPSGEIKLGNSVLKELDTYFGSYGVVDTGGRQILLNYRALNSPQEIATTIELRDIIEDRIPPSRLSQLQGRIVLIGIADSPSTSADYWPTPFNDNRQIPGVFIQAQMVSQLISAVLDKRPLLIFLPWWLDFFWILTGCLIAGLLHSRIKVRLGVIILVLSGVNFVLAYVLFLQGYILPIVPYILALSLYGLSEKLSLNWRNYEE